MFLFSKKLKDVENQFFELDHDTKKALMRLEFDKPSDIFDINVITKKPVLSDDFMEWMQSAFDYAPRKYKIDIDVAFNDLDGYTEEELKEIFFTNMRLEGKKLINGMIKMNKIAFGLVGLGLVLLVGMILILSLWKNGGAAKEIFSYIIDIAVTVTFWEALTILIVENKTKRDLTRNLVKRFDNIIFRKK